MKNTLLIFAAVFCISASSCIKLDPELIDNTIARLEARDIDFDISVTYTAEHTIESTGMYEAIYYNDVGYIKELFKNFRLKGNIDFKGVLSSSCNSGFNAKVMIYGLDGVFGQDAELLINGQKEYCFGPNLNKEPMALKLTSEYEFSYFTSIVFFIKPTDKIMTGDSFTIELESFTAEDGGSVIIK